MKRDDHANLFLRFKGPDPEHDSEVPLGALADSLAEFDGLFRELFRILGVSGEPKISATAARDGSIIIDLLLALPNTPDVPPFLQSTEMIDFLRLVGGPTWDEVNARLNDIIPSAATGYGSIEKWVSEHPVTSGAIGMALKKLFDKATKSKDRPDLKDRELSASLAEDLHRLHRHGDFARPLRPIMYGEASSIEVSDNRQFRSRTTVDADNVGQYAPESMQVLPQLRDGEACQLVGELTSLKGTRGDSMTLQTRIDLVQYNLALAPADGKSSKDYRDLYQERVLVDAKIQRDSPYVKPKLLLGTMELRQSGLDFGELDGDERAQETP